MLNLITGKKEGEGAFSEVKGRFPGGRGRSLSNAENKRIKSTAARRGEVRRLETGERDYK